MIDPEKETVRPRRLNIRLTEQEWIKIRKLGDNSTCRNISDYCRKVLLKEPVKVFYRNKSFDEFEEHMVKLLPDCNTLGLYLRLLVDRLERFEHCDEVKEHLPKLEKAVEYINNNIGAIKDHLAKLADTCAPK